MLPIKVIPTSAPWMGTRSPQYAAKKIQASPAAIRQITRTRRCARKPRISAMAPTKAMNTASERCVRSSEGRKCAKTADIEKRMGVSRQCTMHSAEAQIPMRSAHIGGAGLLAISSWSSIRLYSIDSAFSIATAQDGFIAIKTVGYKEQLRPPCIRAITNAGVLQLRSFSIAMKPSCAVAIENAFSI